MLFMLMMRPSLLYIKLERIYFSGGIYEKMNWLLKKTEVKREQSELSKYRHSDSFLLDEMNKDWMRSDAVVDRAMLNLDKSITGYTWDRYGEAWDAQRLIDEVRVMRTNSPEDSDWFNQAIFGLIFGLQDRGSLWGYHCGMERFSEQLRDQAKYFEQALTPIYKQLK